jgi:hypothetical protein
MRGLRNREVVRFSCHVGSVSDAAVLELPETKRRAEIPIRPNESRAFRMQMPIVFDSFRHGMRTDSSGSASGVGAGCASVEVIAEIVDGAL